jgi:hypothetical protein
MNGWRRLSRGADECPLWVDSGRRFATGKRTFAVEASYHGLDDFLRATASISRWLGNEVAMNKPIAVVQGAPTPLVQDLLRRFVAQLSPEVRVAGVIEEPAVASGDGCSAGDLRSLEDGRRFPLLQDLGPGAAACGLDAEGVVSACEAVQQSIRAGCDLVVLSKFGRLEAERSGLAQAFASAIDAGCPILTSVAPRFGDAWDRFAAPLYVILPADLGAIEAWWQGLQAHRSPSAEAVTPA